MLTHRHRICNGGLKVSAVFVVNFIFRVMITDFNKHICLGNVRSIIIAGRVSIFHQVLLTNLCNI